MKKRVIISVLVAASSVVSSMAFAGQPDLPQPNSHLSHATAHQPRFSSIDSMGNLNITIKPVTRSSHVSYSIKQPGTVYAHIRNHILYLRQTDGAKNAADVTLHMNRLDNLSVYGNANITANNIKSNALSINTTSNGNIMLNGMMTLNNLFVAGNGNVSLRWVNGADISIYSKGNSHITIAGNVGKMLAKLSGHSFLNAKYLRTKQTWIKTTNFAQAQILSSATVQAYAHDQSNVYYYKTPQLINRIDRNAGNTLQLGWNG
ncbi:MAG: hypothetical protein COB66_07375 [Coxiella sp. (in: Bacteria)]|nr:MAG: hypothetical protein COB66_07375 [Coxiella sp. (in: g-proteobacteria)]